MGKQARRKQYCNSKRGEHTTSKRRVACNPQLDDDVTLLRHAAARSVETPRSRFVSRGLDVPRSLGWVDRHDSSNDTYAIKQMKDWLIKKSWEDDQSLDSERLALMNDEYAMRYTKEAREAWDLVNFEFGRYWGLETTYFAEEEEDTHEQCETPFWRYS